CRDPSLVTESPSAGEDRATEERMSRYLVLGIHDQREDIEPLATAFAAGSVFLSAIEVPEDQPAADRALLLRALEVRRELLERGTFIAVRYGFFVSSQADLAAKSSAHAERWRTLLDVNRGLVEMSLKVVADAPQKKPDRHDFTSGREYLRALHGASRSASVDAGFRSAVDERLIGLCLQHRWIHRDASSQEVVLLVDKARADELARAAETLKADFPHVAFLLSGPWPLEEFADDHQQ
ncbi:MAG TPA: GvpL/GvpF family gas vesicle protein, partial [Thermoanaerobaculia bacterium]|nr:GvpL/GvpF family gas vesicle protein [Thermoanaerobaculia bacterium]